MKTLCDSCRKTWCQAEDVECGLTKDAYGMQGKALSRVQSMTIWPLSKPMMTAQDVAACVESCGRGGTSVPPAARISGGKR